MSASLNDAALELTMPSLTGRSALSAEQQTELNRQKRHTRLANEKYFRAHPELRVMLGTFMAELLEARPEDVHGFAAQFFADRGLALRLGFEGWERPETEAPPAEEAEEEGPLAAVSGDSVEDLEALLVNLFKEADVDGSGALDYKEFRAVMKTAQLGLSSDDVKHLLAEADEDGNGLIEYAEFVPLAVDVVQTLRLKAKVREQEAVLGDDARMLAMEMLNGLSKDELLELLKACFNEADKDASGALSRAELKRVLRSARLGLTEHQINLVMVNVDSDHDGALTFEEVGPLIYEIMLESTAEMLRAQSLDETGVEISRAFERADKGGDGVLEVKAAKKVLRKLFPGLSKLQLNAIVSEAPVNDDRLVMWAKFVPIAATMVAAMTDPRSIQERAELVARSNFEPVELMDGKDAEGLQQTLLALFRKYDTEGKGHLSPDQFTECLANTSLGLSAADVDVLLDMADADEDDRVSYEEFAKMAFDVLLYIARERAIIAAAEKEKKAAAAAATSVQKATRGRQARDEMKAKQAAATSVQKATRGRLARTNSQRIRGGDKLE